MIYDGLISMSSWRSFFFFPWLFQGRAAGEDPSARRADRCGTGTDSGADAKLFRRVEGCGFTILTSNIQMFHHVSKNSRTMKARRTHLDTLFSFGQCLASGCFGRTFCQTSGRPFGPKRTLRPVTNPSGDEASA